MTEQASQVPVTVQIAYRYLTFKEETTAAGTKSMHATGRIEGQISKLSSRIVERSTIRLKSMSVLAIQAGWCRGLSEGSQPGSRRLIALSCRE
jgi:hypothetical protein